MRSCSRILAEKIHDNRFLRLIKQMLQAGYLEDWEWNATLSGVPQGGVVSPVLSNIYLDRLDKFVETVLIPEYTRGAGQGQNPRTTGGRGSDTAVPASAVTVPQRGSCAKQQRSLPSRDPHDPGYRRLRYVTLRRRSPSSGSPDRRPKPRQIKARLAAFLRDDLKLELNEDKTLITHARTSAARFLGYEITVRHSDRKLTRGRREVNGDIALRVPLAVIKAKTRPLPEARETRVTGPG